MIAILCFLAVIITTVAITFAAQRRTRSVEDFYVAGGRVGGVANGFAIAGDFMSAATVLGTPTSGSVTFVDVPVVDATGARRLGDPAPAKTALEGADLRVEVEGAWPARPAHAFRLGRL